jgi:pilus assembly protein CpaF
MAGRFTVRRSVAPEPPPESALVAPALQPMSWMAPPPELVKEKPPAESANPLLTDKLLDAKVRLHRRLIEEINLSALEKLPEEEMRPTSSSSSRSTSWPSGWR